MNSAEADAGATGVAKTLEAYSLMRVVYLWDTNGARLNYDGDIDDEIEFDASNLPVKEFSDDNFDGEFDTRTIYEFGIIKETLSDLDKDGEEDLRVFYNYGVMKKLEVLAEGEWKVVWIEK